MANNDEITHLKFHFFAIECPNLSFDTIPNMYRIYFYETYTQDFTDDTNAYGTPSYCMNPSKGDIHKQRGQLRGREGVKTKRQL